MFSSRLLPLTFITHRKKVELREMCRLLKMLKKVFREDVANSVSGRHPYSSRLRSVGGENAVSHGGSATLYLFRSQSFIDPMSRQLSVPLQSFTTLGISLVS